MRRHRWLEPRFLLLLCVVALALSVFLQVADEVVDGETHDIDAAIMLALHPGEARDGSEDPRWLRDMARDITSLGSTIVLSLVVAVAVVYLLLARRYRLAGFALAATSLGAMLNSLLKMLFDRSRPDLILHDIYLSTSSFPSGHAMSSATVYLTLGAMLAQVSHGTTLKMFVLGIAALLTLLVGLTRVYLGVHWPTDVLAGWSLGAAWALGCWMLAQYIHAEERGKPLN
jgi:undecaprenyl-diphosphatase